jgi:ketosteroid isomerase-like protein
LAVDQETKTKSGPGKAVQEQRPGAAQTDASVDEFFNRLQADMHRPDLSQEAIYAAYQAIQKLALESDPEEAVEATGHPGPEPADYPPGAHYYHHHFHHHYFPTSEGAPPAPGAEVRPTGHVAARRDVSKGRPTSTGTSLSRTEAAVRRMTLDWAQACNNKHLDDLVELYTADALVLRPNVPPVRGTAAIREFFFGALDAGLGEAELDPLRVEIFGDVAYEAGRCKTLVPIVVGKRREERGKYLILLARQPAGDWKILSDCWSSDLSLAASPEVASPANPLPRPVRKSP